MQQLHELIEELATMQHGTMTEYNDKVVKCLSEIERILLTIKDETAGKKQQTAADRIGADS